MAEKLTPQQQQAVCDRGGKLLVSAAAGSGKTKVLVDRLLSYLTDPVHPANLDEFLIITYTKAAASELRGKIAAKLTERIALDPDNKHLQKQMQRLFLTKISTVHGFCSDLLKEYAYRLDIGADFRVGDENECGEIRQQVMSDLLDHVYEVSGDNPEFQAFVDTQGLGRDDRLVPEILMKVFDSARCHLNPEQWLQQCLDAVDTEGIIDASETVWGRYLLEDLFSYLDRQILVLEECVALAERCEGFEKPAVNLRDTLNQLKMLRESSTWDAVSGHRAIDYGRLTFPRKNPDPDLSDRIKAARNACKKGLEKKLHSFADNSRQILSDLDQSSRAAGGLVSLVRQFDKDYRRAKAARRILDFGDLEHRTLDLLLGKNRSTPTQAALEIGRRYREIMVDEYQDSNGVQDAIFDALTKEKQNCFMVGDVKQSIYQFRLADPGIFLDKYHTYCPAGKTAPGEGRKVLLSANFRSGGEIIEAVNDVFSACMSPKVGGLVYGDEESLREGVSHEPLPDPAVELYGLEIREDTYAEEAAFVARRIYQMLREGTLIRRDGVMKPVQPEDIVILLRSPGSVGKRYQTALEALGIRCATGGGTDLLKTQEVASLRSFLETIANPLQDIPLISALASPIFGFTADDLASFRSLQKKGPVYEALRKSESPKAKAFLTVLSELREDARMCSLTELLEKCFAITRLDSVFGAMAGGEAKRANLQSFYQLAVEFESGSLRDLTQFLQFLTGMEDKGILSAAAAGGGAVSIMSIHKSKGLEFPVVFLSALSRDFNRENLRAQILCDQELGLGLTVADTENRVRYPSVSKRAICTRMTAESLSEEMRVLYVAMTRARDRLIMTYSVKNLQSELSDIALRMDFSGKELLSEDVNCPGKWILQAAMSRTDAGAFQALGGRPAEIHTPRFPWKIEVTQAPETEIESAISEKADLIPGDAEHVLSHSLTFRYAHQAATRTPSKQTATGRKGRQKDEEVAENASQHPRERSFRKPGFQEVRGKIYGSAIHGAMQYIRYESCDSVGSVEGEIRRMVAEGFLTEDQGRLVSADKITAFFQTDLGRKLRSGAEYLREFKFSILDDGTHYGEGLEGEQILLQGVVDCALIEEDGITILDFKTDYVTEETLALVTERYRAQIETYAEALRRIYEKPIKASLLYFFRLNQFVQV